jgi:type IV fimbrial biogenesis protein FimT
MEQLTARRYGSCPGGFTLVELLVTVCVITILLTLAVPSLVNLSLNQIVRGAAGDLQTSLVFARSEAITRAANVNVVPVSSDWKNGWTVQLTDGTVLRRENALDAQLDSMAAGTITYQADGHVPPPVPGQMIVRVSGNSQVTARCVRLDLSGRPSLLIDSDGNPVNGCN